MRHATRLEGSPIHAAGNGRGRRNAFERECVAFFSELAQVIGVPRSLGQIYGLLFASEGPLGFADIVERLEISKGSASQGLRYLRELGAVLAVRSPDGHREELIPEVTLRKLVGGLLREKIEPLSGGAGARMRRLEACVRGSGDGVADRFVLERVAKIKQWQDQIRLILPILKTILGPGA